MTIRLDGQAAIVTGAGQGLGRTHALALAERGATDRITGRRRAIDEIWPAGG